jgi:hypothetical protein
MAPEQLAGQKVSAESDIYALAWCSTKCSPASRRLEATRLPELRRLREESRITPPSMFVSGMEPTVERAILRCLEADPKMRPASAHAVAALLPGAIRWRTLWRQAKHHRRKGLPLRWYGASSLNAIIVVSGVTVGNRFRTEQPNAEFIDERARFERVVKPFVMEKARGDRAQLWIHGAEQALTSVLIASRQFVSHAVISSEPGSLLSIVAVIIPRVRLGCYSPLGIVSASFRSRPSLKPSRALKISRLPSSQVIGSLRLS